MKKKEKQSKQGPCGSFCFKYWIGSGCDDCIDYKLKIKNANTKGITVKE